jgi:hypothetical protein
VPSVIGSTLPVTIIDAITPLNSAGICSRLVCAAAIKVHLADLRFSEVARGSSASSVVTGFARLAGVFARTPTLEARAGLGRACWL